MTMMDKAKYIVRPTTQFKKEYKLAERRGHKMELLDNIIAALAQGEKLPAKNRDHALGGKWRGHRECHIQPDWLLIYCVQDDVLILTLVHTGTHSDLFPE